MTIVVCPLDAVFEAERRHRPTHVVSLLSPDAAPPEDSADDIARLHLRFNDIIAPRDGLIAPDIDHVRALLAFIASWDARSPLLIHCWAGVSRSTAAGYIAAAVRDGPGNEGALATRLRRAAPFATPNRLLVALADAELGRGGAMIAAVDRIGRGADITQGALFLL